MRVLLVSFVFPPSNVIGSVRVSKMAKHFIARGHDVRVLTARASIFSQSLKLEIPPEQVRWTSWFNVNWLPITFVQYRGDFYKKGYSRSSAALAFFGNLYKTLLNFPDGQIGWLPSAVREGARIIKQWRPDVIYASAMPFTSLLVGSILSRRFDVPWIAEYRDLWVDGQYYDYPRWRSWLEAPVERSVVKDAAGLVTVSDPLADELRAKFGKPTATILNGFDSEDFSELAQVAANAPPRDTLDIVYTGMVYPGRRDPSSLFKAIAALGPDRERIRIRFFGRMLPGVEELAKHYRVEDCVEVHEPVSYQESLQRQVQADVLLLLLWNDPREKGVFTGKLFEYLGARRPILSVGLEDGVAASLVREKGAGLATNDPEVIAKQLRVWLGEKARDGSIAPTPVDIGLGFSREEQFARLESFIAARLEEERARRAPRVAPAGHDVLVVIGKLDLGGTENHLLKVLPRLLGRGINVRVLAMRGGGALDDELRDAGVPVISMPNVKPPIGFVLSALRLLWLYLRERPSIVHFFLPQAYVIGGMCALLVGQRRCVMSRRSLNFYQGRNPLTRPLERWLHRQMDAVIGNSKAVVSQLREEGVPEDRLGLIYNGVDSKTYTSSVSKRELRRQLDLPTRDVVIVHVANLIPYKGHADLLDALASVEHRMPVRWTLLLVGRDDGIGRHLHAQVGRLGLDDHVRWLGERRDIPAILGAADIGVLPSHEEGFSNSALECMAAGIPMVVTAVGGNPEAVKHGVTGFVVPSADSLSLGQAILTLATDARLRADMGRRAREVVRAEFSLDGTTEQYWRLYRQLLAPSPSASVDKVLQ